MEYSFSFSVPQTFNSSLDKYIQNFTFTCNEAWPFKNTASSRNQTHNKSNLGIIERGMLQRINRMSLLHGLDMISIFCNYAEILPILLKVMYWRYVLQTFFTRKAKCTLSFVSVPTLGFPYCHNSLSPSWDRHNEKFVPYWYSQGFLLSVIFRAVHVDF